MISFGIRARLKHDFLVLTKCLYHVLEESPSLSVNARSVIISLSFNSLTDTRFLFALSAYMSCFFVKSTRAILSNTVELCDQLISKLKLLQIGHSMIELSVVPLCLP